MASGGLFDELVWRGLAHQWTGEGALAARLRAGPVTLYHGIDPTADSLHIGNLVGLTALRRFQRAGHRPIAIAGGATGIVGDPSGHSEERNLLDRDELAHNLAGIREQIGRFLDLDHGAQVLNNADWLGAFSYLDFLRDVGKHFPVNAMLAKESVRARLASESGISYTEFSYMLMQAYDFVHLWREHGCELQIGGSDQFGNITMGIELARRMHGAHLLGLTWPLVKRSDGAKMGKTAEGAVWLSAERTSPYSFYQWFVRVPDDDAGPFLRLFTDLPPEEVEDLERQVADAPAKRAAQRRLARELTVLVHGEAGLAKAQRASEALFGGDLDGLEERELLEIFADVPSVEVPKVRLDNGVPITEAFVESGLAGSKGEARRLIDAGGAYVNNRRVASAEVDLSAGDLVTSSVMVLRAGKKSYALLRAV